MRGIYKTGFAALLAITAAGCADLTVPNNNDPDRSRVIASPQDVESIIGDSYLTLFYGLSFQQDLVLGAASFNQSPMAANYGMIFNSQFPRQAIGNSPADAYKDTYEELWYAAYSAIASATNGLRAIDPANPESFKIIDDVSGEDNTPRARAFGKFVQGLSHGHLALTYDKAFINDETVTDVTTLELQPYAVVMEAALTQLGEAIAIADANDFDVPASWFANWEGFSGSDDQGFSSDDLSKLAHSYRARFRMDVARTPEERNAVNWAAVMADINAGVQSNVSLVTDSDTWFTNTVIVLNFFGAWNQLTYQILGMADQSGKYQAWLTEPAVSRRPFAMITPDKRFPQGDSATQATRGGASGTARGKYYIYKGISGHVRGDRGQWRWSLYRDNRLTDTGATGQGGPWVIMSRAEMDLRMAEAQFRTGNMAAAAELINKTRVANGGLNATNAAGLNTSCVPKLPNGSCGNLFEMLKWERRVEDFHTQFGGWFFDSRGWGDLHQGTALHMPVPGKELGVLQLPSYTYGGGGEGSAGKSTYAFPTEQ